MNSIGDQARAFVMQSATNRLKTTMTTLTQEVASGEVADLGQRLQGNTRALNQIEGQISQTTQLQNNTKEAGIQLQAIQDIFAGVRTITNDLGINLVSDPFAGSTAQLGTRATEVSNAFDTVIQRLNGMDSNRYLLSGLASDQQPLSDSTQILDALQAVTAGMTTADDISMAITGWFDAAEGAGGFLDVAYHGTTGAGQSIPVTDRQSVQVTTSAASPAVRDMLKGLAMAAILDRGVLAGQPDEQNALLRQSGHALIAADSTLLGEMGRVGLAQQSVARAETANAAALSTLEISRNDIRSADPYETATALTEVELQLEALFAVTARLSRLNLVDYL
jgi:flagellar hook-associated protein 3 FlgL